MLHSLQAKNQIVQAFNFKPQNIKTFLGSVFNVQNQVPLFVEDEVSQVLIIPS